MTFDTVFCNRAMFLRVLYTCTVFHVRVEERIMSRIGLSGGKLLYLPCTVTFILGAQPPKQHKFWVLLDAVTLRVYLVGLKVIF